MVAIDNTRRLTIPETAKRLQVDPVTLRRWIRSGFGGIKLPAMRIGKRLFIDPSDLDRFLKATAAMQGDDV